ncbi:MAG: class I SAM-dependent methyltransferase [archaeon]
MVERTKDEPYWNAWDEMVKASIARNTVELPLFLSITDFENKQVLDAGAGVGRVAFKVQGFCDKITCLDENDWALKALEKGKEKLGLQNKIEIKKGSIKQIPLPDNSFDITYALWVMHHYKPDWELMIKEMVRVTKPGGFIITCFSTEKGSIPVMEAIKKENEIQLRKEFPKKVQKELEKNNCSSGIKKAMLPFYFKNADFTFRVLSETFLPKPLEKQAESKVKDFIKKHSNEKGTFLDEEVAFVFGRKS